MAERKKDNLTKLDELRRISKLPFHTRIQERGQEDTLKLIYDNQRWAFERLCKKDKIHKEDWQKEFIIFWCGFLKGEYKSINKYLRVIYLFI